MILPSVGVGGTGLDRWNEQSISQKEKFRRSDPAIFRAGELKLFVSIQVPASAYRSVVEEADRMPMDDMLAMVHYFRAREDRDTKKKKKHLLL